jgi:hypothetical protein
MSTLDMERLKHMSNMFNILPTPVIKNKRCVTIATPQSISDCDTPEIKPRLHNNLKTSIVKKEKLLTNGISEFVLIGGKELHKQTIYLTMILFIVGICIWMYTNDKQKYKKIKEKE